MKKGNIRSIRFSDEMIDLIDQQVGDNFTQKFERLVYNCYLLLPEKERRLKDLEELIEERTAELDFQRERYYKLQRLLGTLENRMRDIEHLFFDLQS